MDKLIPIQCPCCGGEFLFPKTHPIHDRLQLSLDLSFEEVQEIHGELPQVELLRTLGAEVYDHSEDD